MFKSLKRVVKKKYIKLCLLAASLSGLMVSSGFSYAKYRNENYGNGNAGARSAQPLPSGSLHSPEGRGEEVCSKPER